MREASAMNFRKTYRIFLDRIRYSKIYIIHLTLIRFFPDQILQQISPMSAFERNPFHV